MSKKLILGLDLGTNWHGWSLLEIDENNEENNKVIRRGSHYVKQHSDPKSGKYKLGERGEYRRTRRTIHRRQVRKQDFIKLVRENSSIFKFNPDELKKVSDYKIYHLAVRGLNQELQPDELFKVLYSKLHFRGSQFNIPNHTGKSISELLLDSFERNKKVRGVGSRLSPIYETRKDETTNKDIHDPETGEVIYFKTDKEETLIFSQRELRKDIVRILDNASYLTEDFKTKYLSIFDRKRDFSQGPGSEKSPTKWGAYYQESKGGPIKKRDNLWETQIKSCPVYNGRKINGQELPLKKVAFNGCISGEIANLVSQLSFTRLNGELLTDENKRKIWDSIIINRIKPTLKNFSKILKLSNDDVWTCYPRTDKKEDDKFDELKIFRNLLDKEIIDIKHTDDLFYSNKIIEIDLIIEELTKKYLYVQNEDEIIKQLNFNIDKDQCLNELKNLDKNNVFIDKEGFCDFTYFYRLKDSRWNFSVEALVDYFKENWEKDRSLPLGNFYKNQIDSSSNAEYMLFHPTDFDKTTDYIYENIYENKTFLSPDIKNAAKEAIRIINKILKFCKDNSYKLDGIILETTQKDSFSSKAYNEKIHRENKDREELIKQIKEHYLIDDKSIIEKIKVLVLSRGFNSKNWLNQDYYDLYDGQIIVISDIIKNPINYEIDHILPISRSALNKYENKVLTKKINNHEKGNKTPFEWLGKKYKSLELIWSEKVKKQNYELYKNLTKDYVSKGFLTSQLNNVSNIMKDVTNGLKLWAQHQTDNNKYFSHCEISTISGFASQKIREMSGLEAKTRDGNEHHSIDASICAMIGSLKSWSDMKLVRNKEGHIVAKTRTDIFNNENIQKYKKIASTFSSSNWELTSKKFTKMWNESLEQKLDYIWGKAKDKKYVFTSTITGDTIYKWIECDGEKHQIEKFKLMDPFDKIKKLDEKFKLDWRASKNLNNKDEYEILQRIWNENYDGKNNPFNKYLNNSLDNFPHWKKYIHSNQVPFIDESGNEKIIGSLKFIGDKITIGVRLHKNSYKSGIKNKCIFVIEENKNGKIKQYFERETYNNLFLVNNQEKINSGEIKILDVIEIGQLYRDEHNNIWRASTFNVNNNTLKLNDINTPQVEISKSSVQFAKLNLVKY